MALSRSIRPLAKRSRFFVLLDFTDHAGSSEWDDAVAPFALVDPMHVEEGLKE